MLPWLAAWTIEHDAAIESAWPWAPPLVTVRTGAVEPVLPVLVMLVVGLVVVVVDRRRNGPAWAGPASTTTTVVIAIRILISTSLGIEPRSIATFHPTSPGPKLSESVATVDRSSHGSERRTGEIMKLLLSYGRAAQPMIPDLEKLITTFEHEEDFPDWAKKQKIDTVKAAIEALRAIEEQPKLRSLEAKGKPQSKRTAKTGAR